MNHTTTCTPEVHTLHLILQAVIIDGIQRGRDDDDLKARAESAVRAFRAGLVAFTAPLEQITGSGCNAALGAMRQVGGATGYSFGQVDDAAPAVQDPLVGIQTHMATCASTGDVVQCGCRTATSSVR